MIIVTFKAAIRRDCVTLDTGAELLLPHDSKKIKKIKIKKKRKKKKKKFKSFESIQQPFLVHNYTNA